MSWRKMMKSENSISNPKSNNSNNSNTQENDVLRVNIADIADIAPKGQKIKSHQKQYDSLWKKAWA